MNLTFGELELPSRLRLETELTDEQLERFCGENDPMRIERDANGELIVMSPTGTESSSFESEVGWELQSGSRADGRDRSFGPTAGFTLPDTSVRAADAAWIRWERRNGLTPEQGKVFAHTCPEFVIEVRSASDLLTLLQEKMQQRVANGAQVAWLIDPDRRVAEIYHPGKDVEVLYEPTSVQGVGPGRGFKLVMQRIWG